MKRIIIAMLTMALGLGVFACSSDEQPSGQSNDQTPNAEQQAEVQEPLDLSGEWMQINRNDENNYQVAVISGDTIEINWIGEDTKSLYWAGSFEPPSEAMETYSWISQNDTERTATALMASPSDTKEFFYENGELSYELTALGITMTVRMERD